MSAARPKPETLLQPTKPLGTKVTAKALKITQNGQTFYFITIPKEDIFPFCYVSDRQEDPSKGFQRSLEITRAKAISRYLDDSVGSIPTNVVLSAQPEAGLEFDEVKGIITFKREYSAFLVLDGQHRLYGYGLTKKPHLVPVAIYENLQKKNEVSLFMDINTTQRGVPAALLLDIRQLAEREENDEKDLRELFDYLGCSNNSPFTGLMSPSKAVRGMLARPVFNRAAASVLKGSMTERLERQKKFELFENYLRSLDESLQDPKLLIQNVYLETFCALYEDIQKLCLEKHKNLKLKSLRKIIAPLRQFNPTEVSTKGKARLTKALLMPVIKDYLFGQIHIDASMV